MEFLFLLLLILVNGLFAMSEISVVSAITILSVILGELVPKRIALRNPEGIAVTVARPMRLLATVAYPLVRFLSILMRLGRIPAVAEHFEWRGWRFEVVDMDGNRIDKVLASQVRYN